MKHNPLLLLVILLIAGAAAAGCAGTESAVIRHPEQDVAVTQENVTASGLTQVLASTRSRLSDVYQTQRQDLPVAFLKTDTTRQPQRDPFDGFRIQLISTRNMVQADSLTREFRIWADTTITGYSPETYMFFKQPFYKVHVGDFHDRSRAYKVSRLIKRKYPAAWVVHDRIDPSLVPADTVQISLVEEGRE